MGLQNPLNYIFDNPNNPIEKLKDAAGNAAQSALDSSFGKGVLSVSQKPLKALSYLAKPYRDYAAPALTAALLELNSGYRAQNSNLSFTEQLKHGFDLSKQKVEGEQEWRRSISPGRALVGLIGDWTPGKQGTDKLDWENSKQVNDFFTTGSAQFFSGIADTGFNILDPVAAVTAKGTSYARKSLIERPVITQKFTNNPLVTPEKLHLELQDAVVNPGQNTAAEQIFKLVEKDPLDVTTISNYGFVRHSTDPARLATAISTAWRNGVEGGTSRQDVADLISAALGHKPSYDRVMAKNLELHKHLEALNNSSEKIRKDIQSLQEVLVNKDDIDPKELSAKMAAETALLKERSKIDNEVEKTNKALIPSNFVAEREGAITSTWSKFAAVERARIAAAEANTKGMLVEVNPNGKFSFHKEVSKSDFAKGLSKPVIRYLTWLSPDTQLREAPAGIAFLGGAAGERSFLEADSRIRNIAKLAGVSRKTQIELRNKYRTLTSKSERNFFFEDLQAKSIQWLLQKHYGEKLNEMTNYQKQSAEVFARELIDSTRRAQSREISKVLEKNYTVTDGLSGDYISLSYLDELVEKSALEHAIANGRNIVREEDRIAARQAMKENPLFETQVPNIHFSYDFKLWDQIMSENPQLLGNVLRGIVEENWSPAMVRSQMQKAENSAISESTGLGQVVKSNAKLLTDLTQEGLDGFYTYLWKPMTLMSGKYTTRNVGEGWLRILACMADYSVNNGYSWTDMFKSGTLPDKGVIDRIVNNRIYRKKLKASSKEFDARNEEMLKHELDIKREIRMVTPRGQDYISRLRRNMDNEVNKARFQQEDGITMCIEWMRSPFNNLEKYKPTKNKAADTAASILYNEVGPSVFSPKVPKGPAGGFVQALAEGDYKMAQVIADTADSIKLARALSDYGLAIKKAMVRVDGLKKTGSGSVDNAIHAFQFGLDRLAYHIDLTNSLLVKRAGVRDEIMKIGREMAVDGKIVKSYTKRDHVEIHPGVFIDQSLAGRHDDMLRNATSSRASTTGVLSDDRRLTAHSFLTAGFARRLVSRADKDWANAHADYVNNVIMRDAVARRMVTDIAGGLSEAEAVQNAKKWVLEGSSEAIRWKKEVRANAVDRGAALSSSLYNVNDLIDESLLQILQYLPKYNVETGAEYVGLHAKALEGLTIDDSLSLAYANRHDVMATQELKDRTINNLYKNAVSKVFSFVGTLPEDHLVRHPFFNMVHDAEAKSIARRLEAEGKRNGMSDAQIAKFIESRKDAIKETATNKAYKELMTKLYSVERYTDPGRFMRFLTPFYMAHQNSSRFWLGQTLRSPQVGIFLAKAYNAPYRSGYVQDEQGNLVSAGHPWESNSSSDQMVFMLPQFLRDWSGKSEFRTSPNSFDIITQGQYPVMPTLGGPIIQPVLSAGLQKAAQSDGLSSFITKNTGMSFDEFTNHFIMPFYTRQESTSVGGSIVSNAVPLNSWMRSALASVSGGNFPHPAVRAAWAARYEEARKQIYAERLLNGQSLNPIEITNEAVSMTRKSLALEAVSSATGPVVAFKTDSEVMRKLRARQQSLVSSLGYNEGNITFVQELEDKGIENAAGIVSVLSSATVDNRYGFAANTKTISNIDKNIKSLSVADTIYPDNPFYAQLFNVEQKDTQNRNVILGDSMFSIKINGKPLKSRDMTPAEADYQRQIRAGWADYFNYIDFLNATAKKNGVVVGSKQYKEQYAPQKAIIEEFVGKTYPQWAAREQKITLHQSDTFIAIANHFINDKTFMNTVGKTSDAVKGLKMYMDIRNELSNAFQENIKRTGYTTLTANANEKYAAMRDYVAQQVIAQHPGFQQMYERYLADDELNPIPTTLSEVSK